MERAPQQTRQVRQYAAWAADGHAANGHSLAAVGRDRDLLGAIVVADRIRENAPSTVRQLHELGIQSIQC